ncbi:MAG: hypothetical protein LBB81_04230, partial [Treponema sp.]|nr:hypothetical protein [Treponema sp.]
MKKISLVVTDADREASLEKLRETGVLHLEKKSVSSDVLGKLLDKKGKIGRASGILNRYPVKKDGQKNVSAGGDNDIASAVINLADEKKSLQDQLVFLAKERRKMEGWGDFDPQAFSYLQEHGISLTPYELSRKEYNSIDDGAKLLVISSDRRGVRLFSASALAGYAPFVFSNRSISQIDEKTDGIKKRCDAIEEEMRAYACKQDAIKKELAKLQTEIEFETANAGMENREDAAVVCWISGFVPNDKLGVLKRAAADYGWALVWEDPSSGDKPPTLVRSNRAVKIIQPLFSFLGTVPGYREYDISPSYLLFFCLFFAMIFGDAAYGSLLFIISFFAGLAFKKKSGKLPDAAKLFMLLSFCTVVWGCITGSWFAIPKENLPSFLRALVIPPFNDTGSLAQFPYFFSRLFNIPEEFIPKDALKTRWNIQFLCFTVGAIQLIWARGKNIIKMLPSLTAFSQLGWLVMMIGLYFLVLFMLLKVTLVSFA